MNDPAFNPGFRFSTFDAAVLALGAAAATGFATLHLWTGIAIAVAVGHFFLFCNIVRLSRRLELIWAGFFVAACALASVEVIAWPVATLSPLVATIAVVALEARRPSYHGIGWKYLNPTLPEWWRSQRPSN